MTPEEFRAHGHELVEWMATYMEHVRDYPVKSQVQPKTIYDQIGEKLPLDSTSMADIIADFKTMILPGITHWQHPNFHAYFPANTSGPSILAEMLTATLGVQGMKWDTSPASTELEEKMMEWLGGAIGIPATWSGVIHDSASTATLAALISAREQKSEYGINTKGYEHQIYRVYCSDQTHSSIEKGCKIAGIGKNNVVKTPTNDDLTISVKELEKKIQEDLDKGFTPLCIVAALGTTGTVAMDSIASLGQISKAYGIWLHVDAAYAGSVLLLPEYQHHMQGIELADSFVFNPHKWLFTNFDCTAYYVKDADHLVRTFAILPEYLKSVTDGKVHNHSDWGIPLGRRFRSLKLWFVLRYYGLEGLQKKIREHIELASWFETQIIESESFELVLPRSLNVVCFRYNPSHLSEEVLDQKNAQLVQHLNDSGKIYITHTKVKNRYTIRIVIGQTNVTQEDVAFAWEQIRKTTSKL